MKTQDIRDLVQEVLSTMKPPWPKGITDQLCIAIENNPEWLNTYYQLEGIHGKNTTNSNIGWYTRDITGLRNLHKTRSATSKLIKTYSELG